MPSCVKTLHYLPSDPNVRKEWMNFIFNEDPDCINNNLVLCSLHADLFTNQDPFKTSLYFHQDQWIRITSGIYTNYNHSQILGYNTLSTADTSGATQHNASKANRTHYNQWYCLCWTTRSTSGALHACTTYTDIGQNIIAPNMNPSIMHLYPR